MGRYFFPEFVCFNNDVPVVGVAVIEVVVVVLVVVVVVVVVVSQNDSTNLLKLFYVQK